MKLTCFNSGTYQAQFDFGHSYAIFCSVKIIFFYASEDYKRLQGRLMVNNCFLLYSSQLWLFDGSNLMWLSKWWSDRNLNLQFLRTFLLLHFVDLINISNSTKTMLVITGSNFLSNVPMRHNGSSSFGSKSLYRFKIYDMSLSWFALLF